MTRTGIIIGPAELPAEDLLARLLRALGHPARIRIILDLAEHESATQIELIERLELAQSSISQHLSILVWAGYVGTRPEGHRVHYHLVRDPVMGIVQSLLEFVRSTPDAAGGCTIQGDPGQRDPGAEGADC